MKVIFKKDVKGQGKKGDVKEVKDGYAKNYLIRNGYAVLYTQRSKEILERQNQDKANQLAKEIKECNKLKAELKDKVLTFKVKTGDKDRVFGSVSTKQIIQALEELGYKIDKKKIVLQEPITTLGYHEVKINLHKEVEGYVTVLLTK